MSKNKVYIYTLSDPVNGAVFYVGKTEQQNPQDRYRQHLYDSLKDTSNPEKVSWIRAIEENGDEVKFTIVEVIPEKNYNEWPEAEAEWIKYYLTAGEPLTNIMSMPKPNDETIAMAYKIALNVLGEPEFLYIKQLINSLDYYNDPIDNLENIRNSLLYNIIQLLREGIDENAIFRLCKENFWEYTDIAIELKRIITDKVRIPN